MNPLALKQSKNIDSNDWCTPPWLFNRLQEVFDFTLDGASNGTDNLLPRFITEKDQNDISTFWSARCFTNPPFNNIRYFIEKYAGQNWYYFNCFLLPFRPETRLWHECIWPYSVVFVFNRRINYMHPKTKREIKGAAFPSCLVFYGDVSVYDFDKLSDLGVFIKRTKDCNDDFG